jgi:Protein of unknown function (DUF3095)
MEKEQIHKSGGKDDFYAQLPANQISLSQLLRSKDLFHKVPDDWSVIITDITGSTIAVLQGKHEQVNLIATGSIVTVLNIAFSKGISIPFFFGGDGATFILPASIQQEVMDTLLLYQQYVLENYRLHLRTGMIPVKDVYSSGHELYIAKLFRSATFSIPVLLGNGLNFAEKAVKLSENGSSETPDPSCRLDLSGMECRWDKIEVPIDSNEVITLLITSKNTRDQANIFCKVMDMIEDLYGPPSARQPISIAKLKLRSTFGRHKTVNTFRRYFFFLTLRGKKFLHSLVEMADTLVIDGRINTVITGNAYQRKELLQFLDQLESTGEIFYGVHISASSIMSCYVRDLNSGHIHFVDGADGGYTHAARMLKGKLNNKTNY